MTFEETVFGPYILKAELGRGAMGVVYAAEQTVLHRQVALKVMRPEYAQDLSYRERFTREASSLARLDSPHVIHIYDFGELHSQLFIAYQLVSGGSLETLIRATSGLPVPKSLDVAYQMGWALRDAHTVRVVHRDVKPSNVLLRGGSDTFSYLCDFGIARAMDAESTATQGVIGTVSYMAPERFDGLAASPASDLYSLGCLLYAMLSGQAPYEGTTTEVMLKHVRQAIPQLSGGGETSARINEILRRSMAKDPAHRYVTADAMMTDLLAARKVDGGAGPGAAPPADATLVKPYPVTHPTPAFVPPPAYTPPPSHTPPAAYRPPPADLQPPPPETRSAGYAAPSAQRVAPSRGSGRLVAILGGLWLQ